MFNHLTEIMDEVTEAEEGKQQGEIIVRSNEYHLFLIRVICTVFFHGNAKCYESHEGDKS